MLQGLLKINQADLDEEEEDEDYVPKQSEIEQYQRDRKEQKGYRNRRTSEEIREDAKKQWEEAKIEMSKDQIAKARDFEKNNARLLRESNELLKIAQKALQLNQDDKRRKVIFAGQEFTVDASGEIVGRADSQAHLKEFQLFDSNDINSIPLPDTMKAQKQKLEDEANKLKNEDGGENEVKQEQIEEQQKVESNTGGENIQIDGQQQQQQRDEIVQENGEIEATEMKIEDQENQQEGAGSLVSNTKQEEGLIQQNQQQPQSQVNDEERDRIDIKNRFLYLKTVMEKISSKSKNITSIHKSKLDWKSFTKKEKLEKNFEQNRKAGGYLDKQSFIAKATEKQKQIQKASRR